jgi:S1-C subfamily serine protease
MRYVAACIVASLIGGLIAVWAVDPAGRQVILAQENRFDPGPSLGPPPAVTPQYPPGTPQYEAPPPRPVVRRPAVPLFNAEGLSPEEAIGVAVYDRNNKSVVNITTKSTNSILLLDVSSEGTGSGSVLDRDGHILTNYHVIEDAQQVTVTLHDGKTYDAKLVGADQNNDIAIISIEAPRDSLIPIELGDSSALRVGMRVFAIGNPFGLERTMTTGIVSSLNRTLEVRGNRSIRAIIQIDAAVNPGNSGGPLLDSHGKLIGMNTAIASRNGQSAGVGFAIPSTLIARVVPQLLEHGRVIRPEIGIALVRVTEKGLLIAKLIPDGPAARAGLRGPRVVNKRRGPFTIQQVDFPAADLIIAVDGEKIASVDDFLSAIESKRPGEQIELTIIRDGQELKVPVVLGGPDAFRQADALRR